MKFCIYALCEPNGTVRYIGKTNNTTERLRNHIRDTSKCHKVSWIASLKFRNEIPTIIPIIENLLESEALELEKTLIPFLRKTFNLVNSTDGGEGISGHRHSPETRSKMSASRLGHSTSDETRRKIGAAHKGKQWALGRQHDTAAKSKIARKLGKPVIQIKNEQVVAEYYSTQEAGRATGVCYSHIAACCRNERKRAGGFEWRYKDATECSTIFSETLFGET